MTAVSASRAADAIWTQHACEVVRRRGIDPFDVDAALVEPEVTREDRGLTLLSRGDLTVVADLRSEPVTVVTALLKSVERWTDSDARRVFNQRQAS